MKYTWYKRSALQMDSTKQLCCDGHTMTLFIGDWMPPGQELALPPGHSVWFQTVRQAALEWSLFLMLVYSWLWIICVSFFLFLLSVCPTSYRSQWGRELPLHVCWVSTGPHVHPDARLCMSRVGLWWLKQVAYMVDLQSLCSLSFCWILFISFWIGDKCTWFKIPKVQEFLVKSKSPPPALWYCSSLFRGYRWSVNHSRFIEYLYCAGQCSGNCVGKKADAHCLQEAFLLITIVSRTCSVDFEFPHYTGGVRMRAPPASPPAFATPPFSNPQWSMTHAIVANWFLRSWSKDSARRELNDNA